MYNTKNTIEKSMYKWLTQNSRLAEQLSGAHRRYKTVTFSPLYIQPVDSVWKQQVAVVRQREKPITSHLADRLLSGETAGSRAPRESSSPHGAAHTHLGRQTSHGEKIYGK